MNEATETHTEGTPSIEQAEQKALGTSSYQKAEVVHRFANENPWFHPLLIGIGLLLVFVVISIARRSTHD